jgi:hypothetical protein
MSTGIIEAMKNGGRVARNARRTAAAKPGPASADEGRSICWDASSMGHSSFVSIAVIASGML